MSKTPRPVFDNATNDLSKPCVESVRVSLRPSLCCSRWSCFSSQSSARGSEMRPLVSLMSMTSLK
jgi:hypothetical protein